MILGVIAGLRLGLQGRWIFSVRGSTWVKARWRMAIFIRFESCTYACEPLAELVDREGTVVSLYRRRRWGRALIVGRSDDGLVILVKSNRIGQKEGGDEDPVTITPSSGPPR